MRICPKCNKQYAEPPALSRIDNSEICSLCGTKEALDAAGLTEGSSIREAILHASRVTVVIQEEKNHKAQ